MSKYKGKKNKVDSAEQKIALKGIDEAYGLITKKLGNGRFMVKINLQKKEIMGRICGSMRRRKNKRSNWVDVGSIVLVGMREFQNDRVDIVHVYDQAEVRELKKSGEYIEETGEYREAEEVVEDEIFDFSEI